MTAQFRFNVTADDTELTLVGPGGAITCEQWAAEAPAGLRPGVDLPQRLEAAGSAVPIDDTLFVQHAAVAGLSAHEAALLGLPPATDAVAVIATSGVVTQPGFALTLRWQRPTGQAIAEANRVGAWLGVGGEWRRLPDPLFDIAEAVDSAQGAADDVGNRLAAIARLLELMPQARQAGSAHASGMLDRIEVHVADAFSLDLDGDGEDTRLDPRLHRAGEDSDAPLLPEPLHDSFRRQFGAFRDARSVYTLGGGAMVVLSPSLRRALSVVHRARAAPPAARRALFANPRLHLREALGDENETLGSVEI